MGWIILKRDKNRNISELKRKDLPNPGSYPILPPDMNYIYFENHEYFPFEYDNTDFSHVNAWWLSECAFLVYCHPGFARMAFKLAGFNHFQFFQGTGTECMVCWNDKTIILSFRGTEMKSLSIFHELRTDFDTIPIPFDMGGKVHKGFLKGLEEIWDGDDGLRQFLDILIEENPSKPLWITGHSLGGALAGLCFSRMETATGLYVFGAPRIGDQDYINLTSSRPVWRIENGRDPVTMVPLDVPALKFNFKDMGHPVFLSKEGEISFKRRQISQIEHKNKISDTLAEQKKRRASLSKEVFRKGIDLELSKRIFVEINDHFIQSRQEWKKYLTDLDGEIGLKLADHMPIYYSSKLWNNLIDMS